MVVDVTYFLCIVSASAFASIRRKAWTTASQEGHVVFCSQLDNISILQRVLSPRWFLSIVVSSGPLRSRFTPSKYQSETDFSAFVSSFRVGVAGGAVGRKIDQINSRSSSLADIEVLLLIFNSHFARFCSILSYCVSQKRQPLSASWMGHVM